MLAVAMSIHLLPADHVDVGLRADLINAAYADYYVPMQLTADGMRSVDDLYDVDLARSVVAYDRSELVGMALLSRRGDRGWVSGVGVLPAWRRRGIGRLLVVTVLGGAREVGVRQVALEVLAQNAAARALYTQLGFVESRELLCWRRAADADALPIPEDRLSETSLDEALAHFDRWHDQAPCWQGEAATLRRMADRVRGYRLELDWRRGGLLSDQRARRDAHVDGCWDQPAVWRGYGGAHVVAGAGGALSRPGARSEQRAGGFRPQSRPGRVTFPGRCTSV